MQWRIRKEDDGDYLEVWEVSNPSKDDPDHVFQGTKGQFKFKVNKEKVLESPAELDEPGEMLPTVDNRTLDTSEL